LTAPRTSTPTTPTRTPVGVALLRYRIMAFATGVVLLAGTIALILKAAGVKHLEPGTGWLWVAHGYLFLIYLVAAVLLGFKLRWPLLRYLLVALAGTIPTMSFVAEHFVTAKVRADGLDTVGPAAGPGGAQPASVAD
jgi:integral membrane protein